MTGADAVFSKGAVMKTGKLPENILKRSVLRQIRYQRNEIIKGAGVGEDCAFLALKSEEAAISIETITLPVREAAYLAVSAAANNLAAAGACPLAVSLCVTLPPEAQEAQLKQIMEEAGRCCEERGIQIACGHTEISPAVKSPIITAAVTGAAQADKDKILFAQPARQKKTESADIVMSKWIGLEGTAIIAGEKKEALVTRYPESLILEAKKQEKYLSIEAEAQAALQFGVLAMHDMRNGGIFGALWELGQKIDAGLCVDLKKIPVRQETIEVCEFFDLNPYELLSGGALLAVTKNGSGLVNALEERGIPASVIGGINGSNDRVVRNGGETRYLGPPEPDEIFKVIFA